MPISDKSCIKCDTALKCVDKSTNSAFVTANSNCTNTWAQARSRLSTPKYRVYWLAEIVILWDKQVANHHITQPLAFSRQGSQRNYVTP